MILSAEKKSPARANAGGVQTSLKITSSEGDTSLRPVKTPSATTAGVFDPEISVVARVTRKYKPSTRKLRLVLAPIKTGRWKKEIQRVRDAHCTGGKEAAKKIKKELPAALFSGVFFDCTADSLITHSGIVSVDVDLAENPILETDLPKVRALIESDPHTLALFLSPSGTGLKVLLRCDPQRPHAESFSAAQRLFRERFALTADKACSDVCRRCFVSFDPDLFQRDDAPLVTYTEEDRTSRLASNLTSLSAAPCAPEEMPADFGTYNKDEVRRILAHIRTRPDYEDWLKILSAVFSVLPANEGLDVLNEWSPEEEKGEYMDKYRHRLKEIRVGTLIKYARDNGFDRRSLRKTEPPAGVTPFPIWSPIEFERYQPEEDHHLLGDGFLQRGEITSLVGAGGLGKTRLTLWWAVCHILGMEWCGLPTNGGPAKWLILSTENSLERWKRDLARMFAGFTADQRCTLEANLRMLAVVPEEDGVINLGDPVSAARLEATLLAHQPTVVVIDPFADVVAGDENAAVDVVLTLRMLRRIQRSSSPRTAVVVLHHARTGVSNVAQAGDNYASGNFGRGSKALYSRVRCELQLAPADRDDSTKLVLCCGK
ncbi:MAG: hypothetical protein FJ397_12315, partial [Verrucomicrobia bacterium]|nr:hypothetical protein [Verrucomicrobiota bacterium]